MADKYLYSGATGSGSGANFANAYTTLAAAIGGLAAGDRLYVANDHAETGIATTTTFTFPGTPAAPNAVLCVTRADPPTTLNTGAAIGTSGTSSLTLGGSFYCYGVDWRAGAGAGLAVALRLAGGASTSQQVFDTCLLKLLTTHNSASSSILFGAGANSVQAIVRLINTPLHFGAAGQKASPVGADLYWQNTASAVGGTLPTTSLFGDSTAVRNGQITIDGVDFSGLAAGTAITPAFSMNVQTYLTNCKVSATTLFTAPSSAASVCYAVNCSSGAADVLTTVAAYQGLLTTSTSIYRDGGASDGTTHYGWTVATTANAGRLQPFRTIEISRFNETTGSALDVTVELATNGVTLTSNEAWIEVEYPDSASAPTVGRVSTACSLMTGSPPNLATSTEPWTGVPGTPVKQRIRLSDFSLSITPQSKGDIRVTVFLAKASSAIYVDPTISVA